MNARKQPFFLLAALAFPGWPHLDAQNLDQLNQDGFPLAVGNRWEYHVTGSVESQVDEPPSYDFETEVTWEIVAREDFLGQDAFRFETTHRFLSGPDSSTVAIAQTWFTFRGDSLLSVASSGDTGILQPTAGQLFKAVQDDPQPWKITSLVFPLAVGRSWDFGVFLSDYKVVEARETLVVPAGEFEAFRVARIVDVSGVNIRTEQWFAAVGLVKMRDFVLIGPLSDEEGEHIGYWEQNAGMELVSFHLAGMPTTVELRSWGRLKMSPWLRTWAHGE